MAINELTKTRTFDEEYFDLYRNDPKRSVMYIKERLRIDKLSPEGGRIFDVGCGIGAFLSGFDKSKWELYGVDVADLAIREARSIGINVKEYLEGYSYPNDFFDIIVFRGSIQLITCPFYVIQRCITLLKPGGHLVFLATPNSNSLYYRKFKTLPFLTPNLNYLIPSDIMLVNALKNFGLHVIEINYPYLGGPYANPIKDHIFSALSFFGIKKKFPFWRSSMEIYARKPDK